MRITSFSPQLVFALFTALVTSHRGHAAPDNPTERALRAGNDFAAKNQFTQALAQYRIVLNASPRNSSALWNGGNAAYSLGDYETASAFFDQLQEQEPNNGHLLVKRIQTAQELGDRTTRDTLRSRIFDLHQSGKDTGGYASQPRYCRDQFFVGKDQVFAYEYFDLKPTSDKEPLLGRRFDFIIIGPPSGPQKLRVECGWKWLEKTPEGKYVPSKKLGVFYYDDYYPTGVWSHIGMSSKEPSFETVKTQIIAIVTKLSSSPMAKRDR